MTLPKTIFLDIDGTILKFEEYLPNMIKKSLTTCEALPGSADKCAEWHSKGYIIILTTGRPEPIREITEFQLKRAGIIYNQLIMGCGSGERIMVNDNSCTSIRLEKNDGISSLEI